MSRFTAPLLVAALVSPLAAQTIDVDQPSNTTCMAGFWQDDLAQSFKPNASSCSGAGLFMRTGIGGAENVTISLYDGLPTAGGTQLATGTVLGNPGTWVDVFWPAVPVTPGTEYFIVFSSDLRSMCVAGDTSNPYPGGITYANAGFGAFPSFDYTFRTYTGGGLDLAINGLCPNVSIDISGGTAFGQVAIASGPAAGSFTIPVGALCGGTQLGLSSPTLRTIQTLDSTGSLSLPVLLPAGVCGAMLLQAVDLGSCSPSNTVGL